MAVIENLLARELFVRVGKQGITLAAAGDPGGKHRRDIEDRLVEASDRDGRTVIADLVAEAKLKIVPGTFQSSIGSRVVHGEVPNLPGKTFDEYVTFGAGSLITTPLVPVIPVGAVILSAQLVIVELVVAGGTSVKVGLGEGAVDPDLYGKTTTLLAAAANSLLVLPFAALAAPLALQLNLVTAAGALGDTAPTAGKVRVKASWLELVDLPPL